MASYDSYRHHLNKSGKIYIVHHEMSIPQSQKSYLELRVGSLLCRQITRGGNSDGALTVKFWRGASFTAGTTQPLIPALPINDAVTTNPSITKAYIDPTTVVTTGATLINQDRYLTTGSTGNAVPIDTIKPESGNIFRPNTAYIIEFENNDSKTINVIFELLFAED